MRSVVQRVTGGRVTVNGSVVASIEYGLLALVGFHRDDGPEDLRYIMRKLLTLRIFDDDGGIMNRSLAETGFDLLLVSQFTLYGDARKGRRPSYSDAKAPLEAGAMFREFVELCASHHPNVQSGIFGARMEVELVNSGPVTILLDSTRLF